MPRKAAARTTRTTIATPPNQVPAPARRLCRARHGANSLRRSLADPLPSSRLGPQDCAKGDDGTFPASWTVNLLVRFRRESDEDEHPQPLSRRRFLRSAGIGAGGLAPPRLVFAQS